MKRTKWIDLLWVLVAIVVACKLLSAVQPLFAAIALLAPAAFGLVHGAFRYRWSGILTFFVLVLVVSNILEDTSILTGFPFGHYYYTSGPKLFLVPLVVGPAYFGTGYLAWVLATVLVGHVHRKSSALQTVAVPFIAAFIMTVWDLGLDSSASTIQHVWIWEQGGGYFGVPITNFLGWFFTTYVFFQLFALFLRFRKPGQEWSPSLPGSYEAQVVVMYAAIGLAFVVSYLIRGSDTLITDAAGIVWHTRSILEAEATVSIFTLLFVAALSTVKLLQRSTVDVANTSGEAITGEIAAEVSPLK